MGKAQNDIPALVARARHAVNEGRFEAARALCARIFETDPGNLGALQAYATATCFTQDDPVFARLETFAGASGIPDRAMSQLHFMRGKALDDMGRHEEAFGAFVEANRLKRARFDAGAKRAFAGRLIDAVQATPAPALPPSPPRMVFILGMPRSGSTLLAQMLGAHPRITSLGEVQAMGPALTTLHGAQVRLPAFISAIDANVLGQARARYLQDVPQAAMNSGHVLVDKMPENYWLAWAIPMLFPDALIVHMRRERLAVCWSCFRNDFGRGHEYSYDFSDLMTQYDTQEALCAAWKTRDPDYWLDVVLDDLATTPRQVVEPLLDRLGLSWDAACLTPERSAGPVRTLSKWQVRRGIDPGIARGWRAYLPMMEMAWGPF